jgi:hypothetical protein
MFERRSEMGRFITSLLAEVGGSDEGMVDEEAAGG